jgi:processing peptidase subunit beta
LNLRGTQSKSREQIEQEIDSFGGKLSCETGREMQSYTLTCEPSEVERAVKFFGDIMQNSLYNSAQIEAEREGIYRNACNVDDQCNVTTELSHYTSYRDHYMGQPAAGIRENVPNVTEEHIRDFHKTHFVGPNFTIAAAGNISHDGFVNAVKESFGNISGTAASMKNTEQPYFTPSIMNVRDDELNNLNVGVFFEAPKYSDPDAMAMFFFQRIMGDYRADKYTGAHLNLAERQYSQMHAHLGNLPDVTLQKCCYYPYKDTGLFGNYLIGNEVFTTHLTFLTPMVLSEYAAFINQVEVFRARAKVFNELLSQENSAAVSKELA